MSIRDEEKWQLAAAFLCALRQEPISQALESYGLTAQERAKGAAYLWQVLATDANMPSSQQYATQDKLSQLMTWQKRWLPIIDTILRLHYPTIHRALLYDLAPHGENRLPLSTLGQLLIRLSVLSEGDDLQRAAMIHLRTRGFAPTVLQQAKTLFTQTLRLSTFPPHENALQQALENAALYEQTLEPDYTSRAYRRHRDAVDVFWLWYLEWSTIARHLLQRHDLLLALGLRAPGFYPHEPSTHQKPAATQASVPKSEESCMAPG